MISSGFVQVAREVTKIYRTLSAPGRFLEALALDPLLSSSPSFCKVLKRIGVE
jgi:hypothetical protein